MDVDSELYISVEPITYRESKSNLLLSQTHLLKALKRLYAIQSLAKQKVEEKKKLQELLKQISEEITLVEKNLPSPKVPQPAVKPAPIIKKVAKKNTEVIPKQVEQEDSLEKELREIQEKLQKLNL